MQTAAIVGAAAQVKKEGIDVNPEIMIPLFGHVNNQKRRASFGFCDVREMRGDKISGFDYNPLFPAQSAFRIANRLAIRVL